VFETRMLRGIFGPEKKGQETGENYMMRSFIILVLCIYSKVAVFGP
jgi:hypothetical protein